jgi:hypothetical protein
MSFFFRTKQGQGFDRLSPSGFEGAMLHAYRRMHFL